MNYLWLQAEEAGEPTSCITAPGMDHSRQALSSLLLPFMQPYSFPLVVELQRCQISPALCANASSLPALLLSSAGVKQQLWGLAGCLAAPQGLAAAALIICR